jgi:hypothetical protein
MSGLPGEVELVATNLRNLLGLARIQPFNPEITGIGVSVMDNMISSMKQNCEYQHLFGKAGICIVLTELLLVTSYEVNYFAYKILESISCSCRCNADRTGFSLDNVTQFQHCGIVEGYIYIYIYYINLLLYIILYIILIIVLYNYL